MVQSLGYIHTQNETGHFCLDTLSLGGPAPRLNIASYDNKEGAARPITLGLLIGSDRTLSALRLGQDG